MSKLIPTYIEQSLRIEHLERELVAARAEIVRLKGEAESWEKVFDRTCEHLAEAKTALAETTVKDSLIAQRPWVGLTGDEIEDLPKDKTWWEIIRAAEEILKEKNT